MFTTFRHHTIHIWSWKISPPVCVDTESEKNLGQILHNARVLYNLYFPIFCNLPPTWVHVPLQASHWNKLWQSPQLHKRTSTKTGGCQKWPAHRKHIWVWLQTSQAVCRFDHEGFEYSWCVLRGHIQPMCMASTWEQQRLGFRGFRMSRARLEHQRVPAVKLPPHNSSSPLCNVTVQCACTGHVTAVGSKRNSNLAGKACYGERGKATACGLYAQMCESRSAWYQLHHIRGTWLLFKKYTSKEVVADIITIISMFWFLASA